MFLIHDINCILNFFISGISMVKGNDTSWLKVKIIGGHPSMQEAACQLFWIKVIMNAISHIQERVQIFTQDHTTVVVNVADVLLFDFLHQQI